MTSGKVESLCELKDKAALKYANVWLLKEIYNEIDKR